MAEKNINIRISKKKPGDAPGQYSFNDRADGRTLSDAVRSIAIPSVVGKPKPNAAINEASVMAANNVVLSTASNITDAENIMSTLPDLELAMQVRTTSILAPNDFISSDLYYSSNSDMLGSVLAPMLDIVREYFDTQYKIKPLLPKMLEKAMFLEGSYPLMIVPESSINDAINSNLTPTLESLKEIYDTRGEFNSNGLLGAGLKAKTEAEVAADKNKKGRPRVTNSVESIFASVGRSGLGEDSAYALSNEETYVKFTDNIDFLKLPYLRSSLVRKKLAEKDQFKDTYSLENFSFEYESPDGSNTPDADAAFKATVEKTYVSRHSKSKPTLQLKTQSELSLPTQGHPLAMHLPPEAVIVVHKSSDPSAHVGYFIVNDDQGSPIRMRSNQNYLNSAFSGTGGATDHITQALSGMRMNEYGMGGLTPERMNAKEMSELYGRLLEEDMIKRLSNGVYGNNVSIANPTEVYRIMFARACAKMQTQLVFVPASMMVYIAFDYNEFGIGRSLLDKTRVKGSQRSMLEFADNMAAVNRSVSMKDVDITLDPHETNPQKAVETIVTNYMNATNNRYPLGVLDGGDIVNYLQRASVRVNITGNPRYPETKMDVNERASASTAPDGELADKKRREHYMGLGVSPTLIDSATDVDFAAQVYNQNILMVKRTIRDQEIMNDFITQIVRKYTVNSSILMGELEDTISDELRNKIVKDFNLKGTTTSRQLVLSFLNSLTVKLPEPATKLSEQIKNYEEFELALEKVLPAFISSELFTTETMGLVGDKVDNVQFIVKSWFMRRWMMQNNMMPELFDLLPDANGLSGATDLLAEHELYSKGLDNALKKFIAEALPRSKASDLLVGEIERLAEEGATLSVNGEEVDGATGDDMSDMDSSLSDSDTDFESDDDLDGTDFGDDLDEQPDETEELDEEEPEELTEEEEEPDEEEEEPEL